eukprot:COSAG02_NODE_56762_length_284_cov_0.389189_1_plen_54_part_01
MEVGEGGWSGGRGGGGGECDVFVERRMSEVRGCVRRDGGGKKYEIDYILTERKL